MSWYGDAWDWMKEKGSSLANSLDSTNNQWSSQDQSNYNLQGADQRDALWGQQAAQAGDRRAPTFNASTARDSDQRGAQLQAAEFFNQQMRGQNSLSAEQLRQGQMGNVAAQQALAASARPGQGAMATRQAMGNAARLGYGMSGQAAMAGIAERSAAAQNYAGQLQGIRGQDLQLNQFNAGQFQGANMANQQAQLGMYGLNDAQQRGLYGLQLQQAGMQQAGGIAYEGDRTDRFAAAAGQPTPAARYLGAAQGAASAGIAASDERLKENVTDASADVDAFMESVDPVAWDYKDEKWGKGRHLGVMAQKLESTEAGKRAVIDTPEGKMVHGAKLSGILAAAVSRLNQRLKKVEGK